MVYKYVSSETILGRVDRLLDSSDWKAMGQLYVSDAIQKIGLTHSTVFETTKGNDLDSTDECLLQVENHLADLPCDLEILDKVECFGIRLSYTPDTSIHGMNGKDGYFWGKASRYVRNAYYTIDNGQIRTSIESSPIKLFYKKFQTDKKGFIMIPDVVEFKEALIWQVFANLILEGNKPKNASISFQEAELRAEDKIRVARGRMKQMTKDEREALSQQMTSVNLETTISKLYSNG